MAVNATFIVAAIIVVVLAVVVIAVVLSRRQRTPTETSDPMRPTRTAEPVVEMTGLESALNQIEASGTPIRSELDSTSSRLDDVRIPDDTGPLLRRMLDDVEKKPTGGGAETAADSGAAGDDTS